MSLSKTTEFWHEVYEEKLTQKQREAVDEAYSAAAVVLRSTGLICAGDDRAEELISAITKYVVECNDIKL